MPESTLATTARWPMACSPRSKRSIAAVCRRRRLKRLATRNSSPTSKGTSTLDEALDEAKRRTRKFARRQQRWFRRDPRIVWFDAIAEDLVDQVDRWWARVKIGRIVRIRIGGDASIRNERDREQLPR